MPRMDTVASFLADPVNYWYWWVVAALLLIAGIAFGVMTGAVQIRLIPEMFRTVKETPGEDADSNQISAFKAFTISAASRVGTGNVAGVAVAITTGGPGAVFWMWLIALVGGATSFVESTLAQLWKERDTENRAYRGGPAYYMTKGLNARWLAVLFGIAITLTYGFVYNAVQTNSIVEAFSVSFGSDAMSTRLIIGAVIAAVTAVVIFGGIQRIANVTQVIVPFMAGAYIIIGAVVVAMNISAVPDMISLIVGHALGVREVTGATLGVAIQQGIRRGLFSNEAGQGSAPNAAATASVSHPVKQGLVQTLGVYFDTLVVCSITAFIILLSHPSFGEGVESSALTQRALASEVGAWGTHAITFILFFLAFSSVIGNYYLAQSNIEYFTRNRGVLAGFRVLVVLCVFAGAVGTVPLVWNLADTFAATMVVLNLVAIIPLSRVAVRLLRNYMEQRREGKDPVFHRSMMPDIPNVECWGPADPEIREGVRPS